MSSEHEYWWLWSWVSHSGVCSCGVCSTTSCTCEDYNGFVRIGTGTTTYTRTHTHTFHGIDRKVDQSKRKSPRMWLDLCLTKWERKKVECETSNFRNHNQFSVYPVNIHLTRQQALASNANHSCSELLYMLIWWVERPSNWQMANLSYFHGKEV